MGDHAIVINIIIYIYIYIYLLPTMEHGAVHNANALPIPIGNVDYLSVGSQDLFRLFYAILGGVSKFWLL